jgi:hypothetical protein
VAVLAVGSSACQCAETQRIDVGRGNDALSPIMKSRAGMGSNTRVGAPWDMKMTGMGWACSSVRLTIGRRSAPGEVGTPG